MKAEEIYNGGLGSRDEIICVDRKMHLVRYWKFDPAERREVCTGHAAFPCHCDSRREVELTEEEKAYAEEIIAKWRK